MAYYEHIMQLPNNEAKCTLCNDIIYNSIGLLEAHLDTKKHKELYMKRLMTSNNIVIGTVDLFCYICNENIAISELITHVQSTTHQNNYSMIKKILAIDGNFVTIPDLNPSHTSAYCIICDRQIDFIYDKLNKHIHSSIHKVAKAMVLQPLNGIFSVQGHDQYLWCKVCQKYFDNYIELIFQHVTETEHAITMAKFDRLIDGQCIDLERYLQDLKEDKAYCTTCELEVPCNIDNLQSHIRGKKHLKNMSNS